MLEYHKGKLFPQAFINGGYVFIIFSPYFIINNLWMGIALLILGLGLSFSTEGIQIDGEQKRFKEFSRYLFIKVGSWQDLNDYPYLSIMQLEESEKPYFFKKADNDAAQMGIYLINATRTQKILICSAADREAAMVEAQGIVAVTGLKLL